MIKTLMTSAAFMGCAAAATAQTVGFSQIGSESRWRAADTTPTRQQAEEGYPLATAGTELTAIAAVVIGGTLLTGGFVSTLFDVLTMGLIQTYVVYDGSLSSWWTKIVIGVLLLLFILLQRGLLRVSSLRA